MLLRRYHNVEQVQKTAPVADEEKVIDKPEVANNEVTEGEENTETTDKKITEEDKSEVTDKEVTEEDKEPEEKKTKAGVKKNGTKTSKK